MPDWMNPTGPDDAWHGDDRADDGGRLDPNTGLPIPAELLDPPDPILAESQVKIEEAQDRYLDEKLALAELVDAIDQLVNWAEDENEPFDLNQCLKLITSVAGARAVHRQAQTACLTPRRPDGRPLNELVDAVITADNRIIEWDGLNYSEFRQRQRALRRAVAALRAGRKATHP